MFIVCQALWVELRLGLCVCRCPPVSFPVIGAVWAMIEVTQSIHKHHSAFRQSSRHRTRPTAAKSHRGPEWCVITAGNCLSGLWIKCEATLKPGEVAPTARQLQTTARVRIRPFQLQLLSRKHYIMRYEEHSHYSNSHTYTPTWGGAPLSKELVS